MQSLAIKYRPKTFDDLTEQSAVVDILTNQIDTNTVKHGYLFCGGAGTGKTTSARIFASMINKGMGEPIELDAASNNSVEDMRRLCDEAQTKSLDSEYKVFIIDECHSLSNQAWQATLKTLEEPPAKSIFIFCTTDPQKIPNTILSRVQRYNFQRISHEGIVKRLAYIVSEERAIGNIPEIHADTRNSLEYIAKIADGGMRDAITLMDKCLSYSTDLTLENVIEALGIVDYGKMFVLTDNIVDNMKEDVIKNIVDIYNSGLDLKQFIKNYFEFILDVNTYCIAKDMSLIKIPQTWESTLETYSKTPEHLIGILNLVSSIQSKIKWEQAPKPVIIADILLYMEGK